MNGYICLSKYPYLYFLAYLVNWCGAETGMGVEESKVYNSTWVRLLFPSILAVGVAMRDVLEGGEGRRESIHCRF